MDEIIEVKTNELRFFGCGFEVKALKEDGTFSGYGATFGNVDLGNDICDEKCFDRSLGEMAKADSMPGLFASHDTREPIGEWTGLEKDKKGLYGEGKLWIKQGIPKADQHYLQMKSKGPKGLSIGYMTRKYSWDEKKGIRTLLDVDLMEISPTPFPMNPKAKITGVKSLIEAKTSLSIREAETVLRDAGLSANEAKHLLSCIKKGLELERDAEHAVLKSLETLQHSLKG